MARLDSQGGEPKVTFASRQGCAWDSFEVCRAGEICGYTQITTPISSNFIN